MTALIVEDIKSTSDLIKERIQLVTSAIKKLDQAYTTQEALQLIDQNAYDIVFWDINLSTGSSFDILKKLSQEDKINFESIFITGQKESDSIITALKYSAIDYLFKPIDDQLLAESIERAIKKREREVDRTQYDIIIDSIMNQESVKTIAFTLIKGIIQYVEIQKICYLEAEGVITKIFLTDNSVLHANKNLGYYKSSLGKEKGFFLASHSAIVNLNQINSFDPKTFVITFQSKATVAVARRRVKDFKEVLNNLRSKRW